LRLDVKETEMVRFGLEIFLDAVVSAGFIIGVAWWLGIMPYMLTAWVTTVILRLLSGGAHSSTLFRCLTLGTIILAGIGKAASMIGVLVSQQLLLFVVTISVAVGFYAVHKWAPADTPAKPIVSAVKRARYKRLSFMGIGIWAAVIILLILCEWTPLVSALTLASIGGFLWQIFSITPAGYKFVAITESLFDKCHIAL